MNEYLNNLNWRYATKKFDPTQKLSVAETDLLEESLRLTPSSFGLQLWQFYRIDTPETRAAVREAGYNQSQITDASHLYALASKTSPAESDVVEFLESVKNIRGGRDESLAGYHQMLSSFISGLSPQDAAGWAARQVYVALGFLLTAAAEQHIDAVPMEGFDAAKVTEIIGAGAEGYTVRLLCGVGHRAADDSYATLPKVRYPKERIFRVI